MRRALVTGGNRGIGEAICEGLAAQGIDVIVGARDAQAGELVAKRVQGKAVAIDLSKPLTFEAALDAAGPLDILVNNAGVLFDGPMLDDPGGFATSMQVMVHAPYDLVRLTAPGMTARGYGRIVNMSSGWGAFAEGLGAPNAYGVAKAALNALTLALSKQLPESIKINSACPGWVRTRMGGPNANRSPEEGADTAIWLATLDKNGPTGGFFRRREQIAW